MSQQALIWKLDLPRGTVSFGRTAPFAGNTYGLSFEGGATGASYTAYLMSHDGETCLAKSASGSIAFDSQALRDEFARGPHETRAFHLYVRDASSTVAEGDLDVVWNPLWSDAETGAVYTMRGPKGNPGEPGAPGAPGKDGHVGPMGPLTQARDPDTGKWYNVHVRKNAQGRFVLSLEQEDSDPRNGGDVAMLDEVVRLTGSQTVSGQKTFTSDLVYSRSGWAVNNAARFGSLSRGTNPSSDATMEYRLGDKDGNGLVDLLQTVGKTGSRCFIARAFTDGGQYVDLMRLEMSADGANVYAKGSGLAAAGMPSSRKIVNVFDLGDGTSDIATGQRYVAPANGWICVSAAKSAAAVEAQMLLSCNGIVSRATSNGSNGSGVVAIPVSKGSTAGLSVINYKCGTGSSAVFVYATGE